MTIATAQIIEAHLMEDRFAFDASSRFKTPEGFLDVDAKLARTGIYEYQAGELGILDVDAAQVIRVLRTEDEVFKPMAMSSFEKMPVTDEHPSAMLDSTNARYYAVGLSGERVVIDGDSTKTKLRITDKDAVDKVESGKVELSCGYKADIIIEAGNDPKFGTYDAIQKNIIGNHIAIVEQGRAGNTCKILDRKLFDNKKTGDNTMLMMFRDVQIDVTEAGKQAIEKLQAEMSDNATALADKVTVHKAEIDKLTTDHKAVVDKLSGELDTTKKSILTDKDLDEKVSERATLVDAAKKVIKDFDPSGKTNIEIKKAVVQAKHADMKLDEKSDEYVEACFDTTMEKFGKGSDNLDDLHFDDKAADSDAVEKARQAVIDKNKDAWKNGKKTA